MDSQQPLQSPIPQNSPPQSPSKLLIIIAIFVFLAVSVTGAYLLGKQSVKTGSKITPTSSLLPTVTKPVSTITINNTTDETSNWKIYKNEKYKFSVKFPNSWTERISINENNVLAYLNSDETFGQSSEPIKYYVWITYENKLPTVDLERDFLGKNIIYKTTKLPSRLGALNVYITKNHQDYIMLGLTPYDKENPVYPSQNKYEEIFNKMLSSFKFLDDIVSKAPTSEELNGFPIYPGSVFVKKLEYGPCDPNNTPDYESCKNGGTYYTWTSNEADKLYNWYIEDQSNSGWKFSGGAGGYDNPQNYGGTESFKKGSFRYNIIWDARNNKIEYSLQIPK